MSQLRVRPLQFDPRFYTSHYPDLARMDEAQAAEHWRVHGLNEGRIPYANAGRESFVKQIPLDAPALEIGPFGSPQIHGPMVRYADIFSTEELRARAPENGFEPDRCPEIHYVLSRAPLEAIAERFANVFSSHCVEHQPDLVAHLKAVGGLLTEGGSYYLIVPDKRYCFDHYLPDSTMAGVLEAHAEKRARHSLASCVAGCTLTTHNDVTRHWNGDHGDQVFVTRGPQLFNEAIQYYHDVAARGEWLDCHAWQFTPESFLLICDQLFRAGLSPLEVVEVNETLRNRTEFCAILRKATGRRAFGEGAPAIERRPAESSAGATPAGG